MDKLRSFSTKVDAISVCVALFLQDVIVRALFPDAASPRIFLLLSAALVLSVIYIIRFLSTQLLLYLTPIRRLILREDYIEGVWLGRSAKDKSLVKIAIRGDEIRVTGQVFDHATEVLLTWKTLSASYDGDELRYLYVSTDRLSEKAEEVYGYCTLHFVRSHPHAAPHAYDGYHIDVSSSFKKLQFGAARVTDRTTLKKLRDLEGTREVFRELEKADGQQPG